MLLHFPAIPMNLLRWPHPGFPTLALFGGKELEEQQGPGQRPLRQKGSLTVSQQTEASWARLGGSQKHPGARLGKVTEESWGCVRP